MHASMLMHADLHDCHVCQSQECKACEGLTPALAAAPAAVHGHVAPCSAVGPRPCSLGHQLLVRWLLVRPVWIVLLVLLWGGLTLWAALLRPAVLLGFALQAMQ